ncbi:MAG TPA: hypothetical protein VGZ32_27065 [Actinocrinis sp.]|jgi:hypothetical protein|uniref:LppU/SCO3897 family protein n=1 Tax=Actinocrinis sp. TaxID=1920516 RepID=UPI002DDD8315|nr:hypothetical protein [Actinocrinis sp.]HEV3174038.1 hypothetical protein [Actinocrinis sp.]
MSTPSDPNGPLQPPPHDPAWGQPAPQPVDPTQPLQSPYEQTQYLQGQPGVPGQAAPQWGQTFAYGQQPQDQNPYAQNPYGQNPYAQGYAQGPGTQNPYTQNPYGQQPYQGYPGYAPPRPPKRTVGKRTISIISFAVIIIVGIAVRVGVKDLFDHSASTSPNVNISLPAIPTELAGGGSSPSTGGGGVAGADYAVGDCMDLQGTTLATDTKVDCSDSSANYKVLQVIPDVSGTISTDAKQCFSFPGNDDELDKPGTAGTVYLYCLGSTTNKHSPRRAQQGDCLDAPSSTTDFYLVACSDPSANYVVLARFDGTNDASKCDSVDGTTESFTLSNEPQVLLCGKTK